MVRSIKLNNTTMQQRLFAYAYFKNKGKRQPSSHRSRLMNIDPLFMDEEDKGLGIIVNNNK